MVNILKNSQCTYNGLIKSKSFQMLLINGNRYSVFDMIR